MSSEYHFQPAATLDRTNKPMRANLASLGGFGVSLIVAASQQTETAESSAREEYPKRIEPRPKHEHDRGDRHRGGLPIGVSRARHHGAAGDDEPYGDRNQAAAHNPLP